MKYILISCIKLVFLFIIIWCMETQNWNFVRRSPCQKENFRVHLLEGASMKLVYQRRLGQNMTHWPCSHNINAEWQTIKNTLQQAANETLGKRKKRRHKKCLILWNEEIKKSIENKNKAYLQYLTTRWSETDKMGYKRLVATVGREIGKIKRQCWETFVIENWTWLTWTSDKCT